MNENPVLVVALGGNALLKRGEPLEATAMLANVRRAAVQLARLAQRYRLVVTHGNGPQVGLLALQNAAYTAVRPYPLDVLDAESEGMIGYLLEQEIDNQLGAGRHVVTLLTRVEIDPADPAMNEPTKPIGPLYDLPTAQELARLRGWRFMRDGDLQRRAVPSPAPKRIVNLAAVQALLDRGMVVVCAGGGGIPVAASSDGGQHGVEAVIDKDAVSSLLARQLGADMLVIATDVHAVVQNWGTPAQHDIRSSSPQALRELQFATGSMAPKVEAACAFAEATGKPAIIGNLDDFDRFAGEEAGTRVSTDTKGLHRY